ncbi:hypothetical protein MMPV_007695 [Pyropia vietnamensis]
MKLSPATAYRLAEVSHWVRHTRRRLRRARAERGGTAIATLLSVLAACVLLFLLFPSGGTGDDDGAAMDDPAPGVQRDAPAAGSDADPDTLQLPHVYAPRRPVEEQQQEGPGAEGAEGQLPLNHDDGDGDDALDPGPAAVPGAGGDGATVPRPVHPLGEPPEPPLRADAGAIPAANGAARLTLESRLRAGLPIATDGGGGGGGAPVNVSGEVYVGAWERIMDEVAVAVKTGREVAGSRLGLQTSEGWLSLRRRVPNLLLLSDEADAELGTVDIRAYARGLARGSVATGVTDSLASYFARGGWKGDKDKNLPGFHLLVNRFPAARFFVMVDDDTYLFLDNFARWLERHRVMDPSTSPTVGAVIGPGTWVTGAPTPPPPRPPGAEVPLFTGKAFLVSRCGEFGRGKGTAGVRHPTFFHGGSGIVLNAAAARALVAATPMCIRRYHSCWAGDMQVAMCLRSAGVAGTSYPMKTPSGQPSVGRTFERGFFPYSPSIALGEKRYHWRWRSTEEPLTFHKMPISQLRLLREYEADRLAAAGNGTTGAVVQFSALREFLLSRGVQPEAQTPHRSR